MKLTKYTSTFSVTVALLLCPLLGRAQQAPGQPAPGTSPASRAQANSQARPEIEQKRAEAEQEARKQLSTEAVAAIDETEKAVRAIAEGNSNDALAAIERATGKINVLVARYPASALLPVDVEVRIIDAAPMDVNAIKERAKAAKKAVEDKEYPVARVLLLGLTSEIRIRTYHLPLATYPTALREAARLLDEKKNREASEVLVNALNTLVVIDRGIPLPLVIAQTAVAAAEAERDKDKEHALKLLELAKSELTRAKELGYAGGDPTYDELNKDVSSLEKQLRGNENTGNAFTKLGDKISEFFKKLTGKQTS
jgi:hypothetical protein